MRTPIAAVLALLLSLGATGVLAAQGTPTQENVLVLSIYGKESGPEVQRYALALRASLERGLEDRSFVVTAKVGPALPLPEEVIHEAKALNAAWVFASTASYDGTRVTWAATAWNGLDGSVIAYDSYTSRPGPDALSLVEETSAKVLSTLERVAALPKPKKPNAVSLGFVSPDEDALVSLGGGQILASGYLERSPDSIELGRISNGSLAITRLPLKEGQLIVVGLEKKGYWPRLVSVKASSQDPIKLPALEPLTTFAWGLDYATGRLLGARIFIRKYFFPDQLFLELSDAPYVTYDFLPGSLPVIHDEASLGLFIHPLYKPGSKFRVILGLSLSGSFTYLTAPGLSEPYAFDLLFSPLECGFELDGKGLAFFFKARGSYSLGLPGGLIERGWPSIGGSHLPTMMLGVVFK